MIHSVNNLKKLYFTTLFGLLLFLVSVAYAQAATLSLTPGTGVYNANGTFTARVVVNSQGQSINAAEGTLKFNPNELTVVGVNRNGSIFNLWVTEPSFSNAAGTISFSGGAPTGYSGSAGTIMSVTFRVKGSGSAKVTFTNGSVLANDGRGSNVLSNMNGGTYTLQAASETPQAEEVIVEYVAPANTPAAPNVQSTTHPDTSAWYAVKDAELRWTVPSDVTAVRTLLDSSPTAIPTKVYETPISNITIPDLDEGVSYFHVQFRNAEGWGRVSHYRLAVDTTKPSAISITQAEDNDFTSPEQKLLVEVTDEGSGASKYLVKIDTGEPYEVAAEGATSTITLPSLEPGYHNVVVEAFDAAGNSIVGTYSFTIASFEQPVFTEYPTQINEEVIPVIKGKTRPNALVEIGVSKIGSEIIFYEVQADQEGTFVFIPEGRFSSGVYELTARATDEHGAQSDVSSSIRIAVQQPGYIRIGSFIISVLSIIIPLIALVGFAVVATWYMVRYVRRFRGMVRKESIEALDILHREFTNLHAVIAKQETALKGSRKTKKLTKAEEDTLAAMRVAFDESQARVEKEIEDITNLTGKDS